MIAGFLFGLGMIAAFVVVANIGMILRCILILAGAALVVGCIAYALPVVADAIAKIAADATELFAYIVAHPKETVEYVVATVLVFGLPLTLVFAMAKLHNRLAARLNPKRAEWIMIGVFFSVPFLLVGILMGFAYIADAIHGPYG
jgi:hypothetical protein